MSKTSKSFYNKDNRLGTYDLRKSVDRYRERLSKGKLGLRQAQANYKNKRKATAGGQKKKHILPSQSLASIHNLKKKSFKSTRNRPLAKNPNTGGGFKSDRGIKGQTYFKTSFGKDQRVKTSFHKFEEREEGRKVLQGQDSF